jgi:hypothetical protein
LPELCPRVVHQLPETLYLGHPFDGKPNDLSVGFHPQNAFRPPNGSFIDEIGLSGQLGGHMPIVVGRGIHVKSLWEGKAAIAVMLRVSDPKSQSRKNAGKEWPPRGGQAHERTGS